MRNNAWRNEYRPRHSSGYGVWDAPSRGLDSTRAHALKKVAAAAVALVVIILAVTVKTYASERTVRSDASTVRAQSDKAAASKDVASNALSTAARETDASEADFDDIPSGDTVQAFSLVGGKEPNLADDQLEALQDAIVQAQELGDVGVVFYDLSSGKGVTYNADVEVYGASSYKALYALFICEALVESGQVSLDEPLNTYGGSSMGWLTVRELIEAAVVNSDNDSFIALREAFDHAGYEDWIVSLGIDYDTALDPTSDFPTYCARTSAKLWRKMDTYLDQQTDTGQWLSIMLAMTTRSFIRDGIADDQVLVRNKAGWIGEDGYYATCDAGLVDVDGRTYVMSIMTSMSYSDQSSETVAGIAKALYDMRSSLA